MIDTASIAHSTTEGVRTIFDSAWKASIMAGVKGLRSRLFAGNGVLNEIVSSDSRSANELLSGTENNSGHIERLALALKIVIPQLDGINDLDKNSVLTAELSTYFSSLTVEWIQLFQEGFNTTYAAKIAEKELPYKQLAEHGHLDAATLYFLDRELEQIKYYDIEKQKVIHNNSKAVNVNEHTLVSAESSSFWTEPLNEEVHESIQLSFNDRVFLLQVLNEKEWCYIMLESGEKGYIKTANLWTNSAMPEPTATLYKIPRTPDGDLLNIVREKYPLASTDDEYDIDYRFYANLLLFVNNPEGKKTKKRKRLNLDTGRYDLEDETPINTAIYLDDESNHLDIYLAMLFATPMLPLTVKALLGAKAGWDAFQAFISDEAGTAAEDWANAQTREGYLIWIPSKNFAYTLREVVNTGSITGNIKEAFTKFDREIFNRVKQTLHEWWPPGHGMRLDFGLGATFVAPVGVDADYYSYIYRDTEGAIDIEDAEEATFKFKLYRRGFARAGLDAGVGASAFLGMGGLGKHGRWVSDKQMWGVGAYAGAEIFAGGRILIQEEFLFDLDSSSDLAFMLFMATQADFFERMNDSDLSVSFSTSKAVPSAAAIILKTFEAFGIDPYDYLSRWKAELALVGTAGASTGAGLRFGDKTDRTTWYNDNNSTLYDKGNWALPTMVAQTLSASLGVSATGEICTGIELEYPDGYAQESKYGFRVPSKVAGAIYLGGEFVANVPILSTFTNWIPNFGGGVKASLELSSTGYGLDARGVPCIPTGFGVSFYSGTGQADFYDHNPASITELELDLLIPGNGLPISLPSTVQDFLGRLEPLSIEKRIGVYDLIMGHDFKKYTKLRANLSRVMIESSDPVYGFIAEGWITFKFNMDPLAIAGVITDLIFAKFGDESEEVDAACNYLLEIFNGNIPEGEMPDLIRETIIKIFKLYVLEKAELHFETGLGVAASVRVGKGEVKARIRGNANIYHVYHVDAVQYLLDAGIDLADEAIQEGLLLSLMQYTSGTVNAIISKSELPVETE